MTATLDTQALKQLDQAHHLHPFTDFEDYAQHGGRIVSRAEHVYIYDSDGNKIQDGMSACGAAIWATVRIESKRLWRSNWPNSRSTTTSLGALTSQRRSWRRGFVR